MGNFLRHISTTGDKLRKKEDSGENFSIAKEIRVTCLRGLAFGGSASAARNRHPEKLRQILLAHDTSTLPSVMIQVTNGAQTYSI